MTIYTPDINEHTGPKYRAIANAITHDIHENRLKVGTKLPTHRDLAYRLGVTVGTITRAYGELQRKGVAGGRVGSGTYVQDNTRRNQVFPTPLEVATREPLRRNDARSTLDLPNTGEIDISMNRPTPGPEVTLLAQTLGELSTAEGLSVLTQYNPAPGLMHHRTAMASLLSTLGMNATGDDIILTSGAQHAMAACALGLLKSGDVLLTENLTYPGMTALASHLGVRVRPVMMDEHGMRPDSLEAAVRETGARVVYLMPIMQNPSSTTMNDGRLRAIADVVTRHHLIVLEDDVYGFQPQSRNIPLVELIPDHTIYINGFAKSISPGLRVGCMKTPQSLFSALTQAVQITGWMIPPLMGEIAARWIMSGDAQRIITWHQEEAIARNKMADKILEGFDFTSQPECLHAWLRLPDGHHTNDTMRELKAKGIILAGPESFITSQAAVPRGLRLCLGSPPTRALLQRALESVRDVLISKPISGFNRLDNMVI